MVDQSESAKGCTSAKSREVSNEVSATEATVKSKAFSSAKDSVSDKLLVLEGLPLAPQEDTVFVGLCQRQRVPRSNRRFMLVQDLV